jgi:hypothetical protein
VERSRKLEGEHPNLSSVAAISWWEYLIVNGVFAPTEQRFCTKIADVMAYI